MDEAKHLGHANNGIGGISAGQPIAYSLCAQDTDYARCTTALPVAASTGLTGLSELVEFIEELDSGLVEERNLDQHPEESREGRVPGRRGEVERLPPAELLLDLGGVRRGADVEHEQQEQEGELEQVVLEDRPGEPFPPEQCPAVKPCHGLETAAAHGCSRCFES